MPRARVVNVQLKPNEEIFYSEYAIRILAEGDSWFAWSQLNLVPSSNILEQLDFDRKAVVVSYAYSGDTLRRIVDFFRNGAFFMEMRSQPYDAILLSAGGNDLMDALYDHAAGRPLVLRPAAAGHEGQPEAYVDAGALTRLCDYLSANFRQIFDFRSKGAMANLATPIFLHTYDLPTPRDAPALFMQGKIRGPWLLPVLQRVGAPAALHVDITRIIFDRLAETLLALSDPAQHIHVVDTRGLLVPAAADATGASNDWINEIHPDTNGYAKIAWYIGNALAETGIE